MGFTVRQVMEILDECDPDVHVYFYNDAAEEGGTVRCVEERIAGESGTDMFPYLKPDSVEPVQPGYKYVIIVGD